LPQLLALAAHRSDPGLVDRERNKWIKDFDRTIETVAHEHGAIYFSTYKTLCPDDRCQIADSTGMPLEFDTAHFTASGSMRVATGFPIGRIPAPPVTTLRPAT
jgi:hypothetical protein